MITTKKIQDITLIKAGRKILGKVPFFSYSFLIDDLLIDTGPPCCKKEMYHFFNHTKISRVVNTHHHEDHIGGNSILKEKCEIEIYAHPLTAKIISQPMSIQLYRQLVWGKPDICWIHPLSTYIKTTSGYVLKVIPTPGHCDDHVCYFEENEGWLFTGDAFLHSKIKVLRKDENFYQILTSLKILKELQPSILFCSLNGRLSKGYDHINRKIEFMENLAFETHKLYKQGISPHQIKLELLGKENSWYYFTLGHFSKQNLINSILS